MCGSRITPVADAGSTVETVNQLQLQTNVQLVFEVQCVNREVLVSNECCRYIASCLEIAEAVYSDSPLLSPYHK